MLVNQDGPLDVFARLRANLAANQKSSGGMYDMLSCVSCTSMAIGAVAALVPSDGVLEWVGYTIVFSAISTLLDALMQKLRK